MTPQQLTANTLYAFFVTGTMCVTGTALVLYAAYISGLCEGIYKAVKKWIK